MLIYIVNIIIINMVRKTGSSPANCRPDYGAPVITCLRNLSR